MFSNSVRVNCLKFRPVWCFTIQKCSVNRVKLSHFALTGLATVHITWLLMTVTKYCAPPLKPPSTEPQTLLGFTSRGPSSHTCDTKGISVLHSSDTWLVHMALFKYVQQQACSDVSATHANYTVMKEVIKSIRPDILVQNARNLCLSTWAAPSQYK